MSRTTLPAVKAPEKSLVERVSALAVTGEPPHDGLVPARPLPDHPSPDGYCRRSPVQILYRAQDYYWRLTKKCVGISVGIAVVAAVLVFILQR